MFAQRYLALQFERLESFEEWIPGGEGLTFVFPTAGAGECTSRADAARFSMGDVLVFNERAVRKVSAFNGGELAFGTFSLSLEQLFPLFEAHEITLLKQVVETLEGIRRYPASTPLAVKCHRLINEVPPQVNLDHRSLLVRVAAAVLAEEFNTARPKRVGFVRVEDRMIQVFGGLSTQDLVTLSVEELADRFGCSRRHLNRLFHQHFGFSISGLKMELRLRQAVSLLRDPDVKIVNLAAQCGFSHLGFFNISFKKRFGTSPGEWRKSANRREGIPPNWPDNNSDCPFVCAGLCPWIGNSGQTSPGEAERYRIRNAAASKLLLGLPARNPLDIGPLATRAGSRQKLPGPRINGRTLR
jgi:AraC-like DNA-binding protein